MKEISNADYDLIERLLYALSRTWGTTIREKENARKAAVLLKKFTRRDERDKNSKVNN